MKKMMKLFSALSLVFVVGVACDKNEMAGGIQQSQLCVTGSCPTGQTCISGVCVQNNYNCGGVSCPSTQVCASNICVSTQQSPLCATPSGAVSLVCWGYPQNDGSTPHVSYSVSGGQQQCCPTGIDGSFTVPSGTAGIYTGRVGYGSRSFETLTTGAYGGQR